MHLAAKEVSSVRLATDALAVLPAPRMGGLKVHSYRELQEPPSEPQEPPTLALSTLNGMDGSPTSPSRAARWEATRRRSAS